MNGNSINNKSNQLKFKPKKYKLLLTEFSKNYLNEIILKKIQWNGFQEAEELLSLYDSINKHYQFDNLSLEVYLKWDQINFLYTRIKNMKECGFEETLKYFELMNSLSKLMKEVLEDQRKSFIYV